MTRQDKTGQAPVQLLSHIGRSTACPEGVLHTAQQRHPLTCSTPGSIPTSEGGQILQDRTGQDHRFSCYLTLVDQQLVLKGSYIQHSNDTR